MIAELNRTAAGALLQQLTNNRNAVLALTRALVEIESPSGDLAGSRAVVSVLADAARNLPGVTTVERMPVENSGEHLRILFYAADPRDPRTTVVTPGKF